MTKTIDTLVEDIYALFNDDRQLRLGCEYNGDNLTDAERDFGKRMAHLVARRLRGPDHVTSLRLSNIGTPCSRKLWYTVNSSEAAETLSPEARIKFLFGDILEELLLFLAAEAGHLVEGRQDELDVNGVKGHRDAVIDGRLVDVKSASSFAFKKFADNKLREDDPFGYIDQLGSYLSGSLDDPLVKDKDIASFLVIDKQLGKICLDTYAYSEVDYSKRVDELREILDKDEPPERTFEAQPEGKSGNMGLCTQCSYCQFKHSCWPELRTFIYSTGPTFLTEVVKEPKVPEVDKDGTVVTKF